VAIGLGGVRAPDGVFGGLAHTEQAEAARHTACLHWGVNQESKAVAEKCGHHGGVFHNLARRSSESLGSPWAFVLALGVVLAWAASGPFFHFSDTWQLVINTSTTVITFLMVFLIQNTQNRESLGLRLKLDELIRAVDSARNEFIDVEDLDDEDLAALRLEFARIRNRHRASGAPDRESTGGASGRKPTE